MPNLLKLTELRKLAEPDLTAALAEQRQRLAELQLATRSGEFKKSHQLGQTRKLIARILTIQRARQLAAEGEADG